MTAVVDRLEAAGIAQRVADPSDRRRVRIEATPKLWEVSEPLLGPMLEESQAIIDDLSDSEIARFTDFMNRAIELQARHTERVRALRQP